MTHPLVQRLLEEFGYPEITLENHDEFTAPSTPGVLFFGGDPNRYKETTDVAVVLPELIKAFGGRLRAGVVAASDAIELQKHYGFRAWPSLVFVRDGAYLGTVSKMKNWSEYLTEISELLTAETREAPGFRVLRENGGTTRSASSGAAS